MVQIGQMPFSRWEIGAIKQPTNMQNPASAANLSKMVPFFLNDLEYIGNPTLVEKIVTAIIDSVRKGEKWFNQAFGGWTPDSNQFGIQPLRPKHLGKADNRWIWTSAGSATRSVAWSADDTFIASTTMPTDELIMVYGYYNLEPVPNTLELFVQPGANKWPLWNIEQMRVSGKKYTIFPDPFIIEPRSSIYITCSTRAAASTTVTEEAGLMGYMFAPNARLMKKAP